MNQEINKETIKELMENPGKCIGEVIRSTFECIKKTKGQEALNKFEEEMKNLGYPIDSKTIKPFEWYPVGLRALNFIALRRAFAWKDKDFEKFGEDLLDYSFVFKMLLKFILSFEDLFNQSSKYWRKHFTIGELETYQFNEKEKYGILRIHNFKVHLDFCPLLLGYFKKLGKLSGKKKRNNQRN